MENRDIKGLKSELGLVKLSKFASALVALCGIVVLAAICFVGIFYWNSNKKIEEYANRIVVLDGNGVIQTGNVKEVNDSEMQMLKAENVLKLATEFMFGYSPINYDERLEKARYYFGRAGGEILQNYLNDNVREKVMSYSLRVDVVIDSVSVFFEKSQLKGKVSFRQSFVNGDAVKERSITANVIFKSAQYSKGNAYGIVVDEFIMQN